MHPFTFNYRTTISMSFTESKSSREASGGNRRRRSGFKSYRRKGNGRHRPQHSRRPQPPTEAEREYRRAEPLAALPMNGAFDALIPEIQHALKAESYEVPTPVQEQAIPPQLEGRDLLGSAQTGTGKTAAFTLPILQDLSNETHRAESRRPRALILTPTRELAAQIGESLETYGKYLPVTHTVIFGGVKQSPQERAMIRGVDVLVATPGRLLDLMGQGFVHLDDIRVFILDEVDRMLDMGFLPDIRRVLEHVPEQRRTGFFSATLQPKILSLAETLVKDPVRVTISPEKPTVDKITQRLLYVDKKDKDTLLSSMIKGQDMNRVIVFTQMKHVANRVCQKLNKAGIKAAAIHGNRTQAQRTQALDGFRSGRVHVLVATDIAARGIDVQGVTDVFNYDLPIEPENYVHRIGRTARAGTEGCSWSFCTGEDRAFLRNIERLTKKPIPLLKEHDFHSESAFKACTERGRPAKSGVGRGKRPQGRKFHGSKNYNRLPKKKRR